MASPTPVLPLVGSTIVPPGRSRPSRSAATIISSAGRSLDEPPGLPVSIFIASTLGICSSSLIRFIRTRGVLPIRSITESAIAVPSSRASPMTPHRTGGASAGQGDASRSERHAAGAAL